MKEEKTVIEEPIGIPKLDKQLFKTLKELIRCGIREIVFIVNEGHWEMYKPMFEDYQISATAKVATFKTFDQESTLKSFRYLGMTIHFKIVK